MKNLDTRDGTRDRKISLCMIESEQPEEMWKPFDKEIAFRVPLL